MQVRKVQLRVSTSGRYAKALFDLSCKLSVFDTVNNDLERIKTLIKSDSAFHNLLSGNALSKRKYVKILSEISEGFAFNALVANLLIVLVKNGRLNLLEKIIDDFKFLVNDQNGVLTIDLEVFKKHPALLNVLQKALKEKFKSKNYKFNVRENPELIAGFMAFINGQCLDYSLRGRLDRMRYQLEEV